MHQTAPGTGMSTLCSANCCWGEEWDTTVGISTNCCARLAEHDALRDRVLEKNLGHFDNVLGNHKRAKELEDVRQLFHHLQHRSTESLDELVGFNMEASRVLAVRLPSPDESSKYTAAPSAGATVLCLWGRRSRCPPWGTNGGTPWPAPQRSIAARVATTSAVRRCFRRCAALTRAAMGLPSWVQPEK